MTTGQTLETLTRLRLAAQHGDADHVLSVLDDHEARVLALEYSRLFTDLLRIHYHNDRHILAEYVSAMGAKVAAFTEGCQ